MDPQRFREAYQRLQFLDERLTYKLRPRAGTMSRGSVDLIEDRLKDLAEYTVELKDVMQELFLAISGKPGDSSAPPTPEG